MSVTVSPRDRQAQGAFDGGAILEHKPIGFPGEGGEGRPTSCLFYWAHAWSDGGGLIGQHPHEGFEIVSYVLRGTLEHFDTKLDGWKTLHVGDTQIIRAGDGIEHAEKVNPGGAFFQIWFDPNLATSLERPASYDDYPDRAFPVRVEGGASTKIVKGPGAPLAMETTGVEMEDQTLAAGTYTRAVGKDRLLVACVISGELTVGGAKAGAGDAVWIRDEADVAIAVATGARWFVITAPAHPAYRTYAEMRFRSV